LVTITPSENKSVKIGDNVLIGPNSSLENCFINNNAFIGMGSSIRKGAKINSNTVLAAGAVVHEN
jgi:gamma-carbonic anhydrase